MKKFYKALSKISIIGLIIALMLNSTAFAAVTQIITKDTNTGKYYSYSYSDLIASIMNGTKLFDDFKSKATVAFMDDKAGNVNYDYIANQFMKDKAGFNLNNATEKAPETAIIRDITPIKIDAKGDPIVSVPQSPTHSQDTGHVPVPVNVSSVIAVNLTAIKVTFNCSVTDAMAAKANYTLSTGTIESAAKTGDREVTLTVSGLTYGSITTVAVISSSYSKEIKMPSVSDLYTLAINTDNGDIIVSDGSSKKTLSVRIVDKATGAVMNKDAQVQFSATSGSLSQAQAAMQNGTAATELTSISSESSVTSVVTATVINCQSAPEYIGLTGQKDIIFAPANMVIPVSASCSQGDRFCVKFSGSINAADYKSAVTSAAWKGCPFGIQYKGASNTYKNIKISDVCNTVSDTLMPDTLMFVLDTDDAYSDTPSIAPVIGKGLGQLEMMDPSFEGTGTVGNFLGNNMVHTIAFPNDIPGLVIKKSDIEFTMTDNTVPTVSIDKASNTTDLTKITIKASEPLAQNLVEITTNGAINMHFTIDDKAVRLFKETGNTQTDNAQIADAKANNEIIVTRLCVGEYSTNPTLKDSRNIVDIEICKDFMLDKGSHTIKITGIGDYGGNKTGEATLNFTIE